jgi:hypothetical protein
VGSTAMPPKAKRLPLTETIPRLKRGEGTSPRMRSGARCDHHLVEGSKMRRSLR